ncbi:IclR family transcriptional regulator [Methylocella tundrae]|uniref:IclR family transcriptional regulator n=1 Tax=Methylocella tundrae TaxID=227605 RepID=A0A8B6MAQ7_METTU|nr:IclR family transcriptional regulator [Methylocella tundrae]VTZ25831.1 IclR family transcriptional regulator [Methylocella tundrae]VTZ51154.1 IclR family transcriptional regulator [Methylocella tundrae]
MSEDIPADKTTLLEKGMALLALVIRDGGRGPLRQLAGELNIPLSTAYRLIGEHTRAGWLCSVGRGRYVPGQELLDLASRIDSRSVLANIARPHLRGLARRLHQTVHLGFLENDMVTYILKERGGGIPVFTQAGMQLEAYCSAIGKMLLASLPDDQREQYIAAGPFVALTPRTIIDPAELRKALNAIWQADYAVDNEEVSEGLRCIAIPLRDRRDKIVAAISMSRTIGPGDVIEDIAVLNLLRGCADQIRARL